MHPTSGHLHWHLAAPRHTMLGCWASVLGCIIVLHRCIASSCCIAALPPASSLCYGVTPHGGCGAVLHCARPQIGTPSQRLNRNQSLLSFRKNSKPRNLEKSTCFTANLVSHPRRQSTPTYSKPIRDIISIWEFQPSFDG